MQPAQFKLPNPPKQETYRINHFAGVNYSLTPSQINDNEAVDILNFELDEIGSLNKRSGFNRCFDSIGEGQINGMTIYRKSDGTEEFIFCHSTKLYKINKLETPIDSEFKKTLPNYFAELKEDKNKYKVVQIYDGIADNKVSFFNLRGKLYILDEEHYLVYDGTNVSSVECNAYVPLISVSNEPTGGGENLEDFNLLSRAFRVSYSSDGEAKEYSLIKDIELSEDLITCKFTDSTGEHILKENTDFTVDRKLNKIVFTAAKEKGTNNLEFTCHIKEDRSHLIKKMRFNTLYGGRNDTRVFMWGDENNPNLIRFSGITDKGLNNSYFPENSFIEVGADNEPVMNIIKQYQSAVIIKEWSMWSMDYQGQGMFPISPLNDTTGCISPYSVQLLRNMPVTLDKNGVFSLTQSNVRDERNVSCISEKVNPKLLKEKLKDAISIDYDNKYILCIDGKCYVYDYLQQAWYVWNNINASCFLEYKRELFFGGKDGIIYKFRDSLDKFRYVDDYKTIRSYFKSKPIEFGSYERNKIVKKMYIVMKPNLKTSVSAYFVSNDINTEKSRDNLFNYSNFNYHNSPYMTEIFDERSEHIATYRADLFSYRTFSYLNFTYSAIVFPKELINKVKVKKILFFQLILENNKWNESLGIEDISLIYAYQNYRK